MKVREHLEKRGERDVVFLSITIDSGVDDSEQLELYRERYAHHFENWYHLTGDFDEIESLRYALGVYDLDPEIDSDKTEHAGIVTFGNDRTDWWAALPALMDVTELAVTVERMTTDRRPRRITQKG